MPARGSGHIECLTQVLSSLIGVGGLLQALCEQVGSVAEDAFGMLSHEPGSLRRSLSFLDERLSVTPICDEDFLVHKTSPN